MLKKVLLTLATLLVSSSAFAYPSVQVWGRTYDYSCGYFSNRSTDLAVTLKDSDLDYGTNVNVIFGFKGHNLVGGGLRQELSWQDRVVVSARAIDNGTWEARLTKTLHNRTEGRFLTNAQFVFEILEPGKEPRYWNGGSTWGYYETQTLESYVNCVQNGNFPDWKPLQFGGIAK